VLEDPAVKVIAEVPAPNVIVPLPIVQAYVAPAPADGTEALLPKEFGQIEPGAAIAVEGAGRTSTLVVAGGETHPSTATVTEYRPDAEDGAARISGFCSADVKLFGPVQL
jgi:hypothetical protein